MHAGGEPGNNATSVGLTKGGGSLNVDFYWRVSGSMHHHISVMYLCGTCNTVCPLSVTPVQLMRPSIGQNMFSVLGDSVLTSRPVC